MNKEEKESMSGLWQKHQLRIKDRENIVNFYKEVGLSSLMDSAFKTGRISECEYYQLKIQHNQNYLLSSIGKIMLDPTSVIKENLLVD